MGALSGLLGAFLALMIGASMMYIFTKYRHKKESCRDYEKPVVSRQNNFEAKGEEDREDYAELDTVTNEQYQNVVTE